MASCLKMLVSLFEVLFKHNPSKERGSKPRIIIIGLFLIDPQGIVRQITINDLPVGRNVDEVLRLIDAFKFTDVHGEVCPANWHQGDMTIKPEVDKSKEYFEKAN